MTSPQLKISLIPPDKRGAGHRLASAVSKDLYEKRCILNGDIAAVARETGFTHDQVAQATRRYHRRTYKDAPFPWARIPAEEPDIIPAEEPDIIPVEEPDIIPVEEPGIIPVEEPDIIPAEKPDIIPAEKPAFPLKESEMQEIIAEVLQGRVGCCGHPITKNLDGHYNFGLFPLDHIIPKAKGGSANLENRILLCAQHNSGKRDRLWSIEELRDKVEARKEMIAYRDRLPLWDDRMESLLRTIRLFWEKDSHSPQQKMAWVRQLIIAAPF